MTGNDLPRFKGKKDEQGKNVVGTNITCRHLDRPHYGRGMCFKCFKRNRRREKKGPRATCHPDRLHEAHGLCSRCYERQWRKGRYREVKNRAIQALGNQCACCNETKKEWLQIHHVQGGGKEHRTKDSMSVYYDMIKNPDPGLYQVLCANCHNAIEYWGYCPHKENINESANGSTFGSRRRYGTTNRTIRTTQREAYS